MENPGIAGCKTEGDGVVHGAGTVRVVIHLGGGLVGEGDGEAIVDALGAAVVPGEREGAVRAVNMAAGVAVEGQGIILAVKILHLSVQGGGVKLPVADGGGLLLGQGRLDDEIAGGFAAALRQHGDDAVAL